MFCWPMLPCFNHLLMQLLLFNRGERVGYCRQLYLVFAAYLSIGFGTSLIINDQMYPQLLRITSSSRKTFPLRQRLLLWYVLLRPIYGGACEKVVVGYLLKIFSFLHWREIYSEFEAQFTNLMNLREFTSIKIPQIPINDGEKKKEPW